jgi:hypothetical protein
MNDKGRLYDNVAYIFEEFFERILLGCRTAALPMASKNIWSRSSRSSSKAAFHGEIWLVRKEKLISMYIILASFHCMVGRGRETFNRNHSCIQSLAINSPFRHEFTERGMSPS